MLPPASFCTTPSLSNRSTVGALRQDGDDPHVFSQAMEKDLIPRISGYPQEGLLQSVL